MRILVQRVENAKVTVKGIVLGQIQYGLLLLIGVSQNDANCDIEKICNKLLNLRIFSDEQGKMNLNIQQVQGEIMAISQFTLHASTKKGNRPGFTKAAKPEIAKPIYEALCETLATSLGKKVERGEFGADMKVRFTNDGPVTIWIDTEDWE